MFFSDIIAWMCTFEIYFADQALGLTAIANNLDDIAEKLSNETNKEKK